METCELNETLRTTTIIFWNARGILGELASLVRLMKHYNAAMACIMESHIYGNDLSNDEYYWIKGPELLPAFGDRRNRPRRGLGMLVNRKLLPGGAEVKSFEHSFWARFPSRTPGAQPLFTYMWRANLAFVLMRGRSSALALLYSGIRVCWLLVATSTVGVP